MNEPIISKDTGVAIGLVATLIGASVSFGIMYQRINGVENEIVSLRSSVNAISSVRDDTIILREQGRQQAEVLQEVREDVKTLKDRK